MSSIPQDLVQMRIAEILAERENAKQLAEQARIQAEIDAEARRRLVEAELAEKARLEEERRIQLAIEAEARRKIIEAELAEKRRLEEERRIREEIERAAIAAIVEQKRNEIKKKQEEIELYRREIIRVQTEISHINSEIISYKSPSVIRTIPAIEKVETKKSWKKSNEYEVDNSDESITKINSMNSSLTTIINTIKKNGKITLHRLKEAISEDGSLINIIRDGDTVTSLSKLICDKMTLLIDMNILKSSV
jgi:hypothetical protein